MAAEANMARPFAAACLTLAMLAAALPASAGEWRGWCPGPGAPAPASEPGVQATDTVSALGWHFYCDRPEEEAAPQPSVPAPSILPGMSAMERILAVRKRLEEARAAAILDPAPAKVAAYLRLQQETLQRAAAFSDAFRRTVWATPALDYTLTRPVGALGKRLWSEARREERDAVLAKLSERYGLIYLGHTDCLGCRVFGPLLRAFALRHGLEVLAVSMSGGPLEGWPEAVPDNGRAARLGLGRAPLPAVALFDTALRRVLPVGFGVLAEDQLAERIFVLIARETGHDY